MCSYVCPCKASLAKDWTDMTETELNEFERTKVSVLRSPSNNNPLTDDEDRFRLVVESDNY